MAVKRHPEPKVLSLEGDCCFENEKKKVLSSLLAGHLLIVAEIPGLDGSEPAAHTPP